MLQYEVNEEESSVNLHFQTLLKQRSLLFIAWR